MPEDVRLPDEADGVFEGGGVKGLALVGGIGAAEAHGVERWVNVAGTSAGAIVACLVAVGYSGSALHEIMQPLRYAEFADYGWPGLAGKLRGVMWNQFVMRGLAPGRFFLSWLEQRIAESPLARELGKQALTFADVRRTDLPPDISDEQRRRAIYRLQVIASDVTCGRMLVLPHDIAGFRLERDGEPLAPDTLPLHWAVRMSMSYPYLFTPVTLWAEDGRPHYVVDGGLLSNFPVWLFDSGARPPKRPTWGFRLHGGFDPDESPPYRAIPMPFWRLKLARAMFSAATEAWDSEQLHATASARTVSIPTGTIATTDFDLQPAQAAELYRRGLARGRAFFESAGTRAYLDEFEQRRAVAV